MAQSAKGIIGDLAFLPTSEGGRRSAPPNPAGGQLRITADEQVTCTIAAVDETGSFRAGVDRFQLGVTLRVLIVPLLPRGADLDLSDLEVFEGSRLVARGITERVVELDEESVRRLRRLVESRRDCQS